MNGWLVLLLTRSRVSVVGELDWEFGGGLAVIRRGVIYRASYCLLLITLKCNIEF